MCQKRTRIGSRSDEKYTFEKHKAEKTGTNAKICGGLFTIIKLNLFKI